MLIGLLLPISIKLSWLRLTLHDFYIFFNAQKSTILLIFFFYVCVYRRTEIRNEVKMLRK